MNIVKKFFASLRLREAIKVADKAHKENGQRYYVMPVYGSGGKLMVVDRKNFRLMKQKHYINRDARVFDLVRECFYCTAYRNGDQYLNAEARRHKVKQYFAWVDVDRREKKKKRHGKV